MNSIDVRNVGGGEVWTVGETVAIGSLELVPGSSVTAPEGMLVTMTVDGVETGITPGSYNNVVLSVTESFSSPVMDFSCDNYRTALYIDKDGVNSRRSVSAAIQGGSYDGKGMSGVSVKSENDNFNGVVICGAEYNIKDLDIELTGRGENDFAGKGAGLLVTAGAKVEVDGLRVLNKGLIRGTVLAADGAELTVKNADIMAYGISDEEQAEAAKQQRGMTGVPWMLGLYGNNRATNIVGNGKVKYIDSALRAERWGVLSTDGVDDADYRGEYKVRMEVENSLVEITGDSGYGAYSIGSCRNSFDNCTFNVPDYAIVIANEHAAADFTGGTTVNSKRFGVMWHQNQEGKLKVSDSTFNTGMTTFLLKGCYPDIEVERSELNAENGVILQLMDSDDPGMGAPGYECNSAVAVKVPEHDVTKANYHEYKTFQIPAQSGCTDAVAGFKSMSINGDFYNSTTNACVCGRVLIEPGDMHGPSNPSTEYPINLVVSFDGVKLTGVISASTIRHAVDRITPENRIEMGQVTNTPAPVVNNGVIVTLREKTVWTVTGDCYLSSLTIEDGSAVEGADGKAVKLTVNGVLVEPAAGAYAGDIRISLA